jgi:hypothetical protein
MPAAPGLFGAGGFRRVTTRRRRDFVEINGVMSWRFLRKPDKITDELIISTLRAVVAERPDYVYERPAHMAPIRDGDGEIVGECMYVHTDPEDDSKLSPGCLVGTVLYRLGMPLEELQRHEGEGGWDVVDEFGGDDSRVVMQDVQLRQDSGVPWGAALELALTDPSEEAVV